MTEKEFVALLAIEGKQLEVGKGRKQIGDDIQEGYYADVVQGIFGVYAEGSFHKRRRDAVQNVIKKYYNRANNRK
jgi:hypothetical protein